MNAEQKLAFAKVQVLTLVDKIRELSAPVKPETALAYVAELAFWYAEITKHECAQALLQGENVMEYKAPFKIRCKKGWIAASGFYELDRARAWLARLNPQNYTDKTLVIGDFAIFDSKGNEVPL